MIRNSYSISPAHMDRMTTPTFFASRMAGPAGQSARKKAPSPLNYSPPTGKSPKHGTSPMLDKSKSWHAGSDEGSGAVDVLEIMQFGVGGGGDGGEEGGVKEEEKKVEEVRSGEERKTRVGARTRKYDVHRSNSIRLRPSRLVSLVVAFASLAAAIVVRQRAEGKRGLPSPQHRRGHPAHGKVQL